MLIINSDDFGLSENVNIAIISSFEKKLCSSTTIMPNMPGFEHACQLLHEKKLINHTGLHLTLTSGTPLTDGIKRLSVFCNSDGNFKGRDGHILHLSKSEKEILACEIISQITKCRQYGVNLTHIDSHCHIHEEWAVLAVLVGILRQFKIPHLRLMRNAVRPRTFARRIYTLGYNRMLRHLGLARTEFFGSLYDYLRFKKVNRASTRTKSFEVMIHPILHDKGVVVDAESNKPLDELVGQIAMYKEAESFSGAVY